MYLSKTKQIICIAGIFFFGFLTQAQDNGNFNKIYMDWQTSDCGITEDNALIRLLLENVSQIEPLLLNGFREGPPTDYLEEATVTELNRMRLNQKLISGNELETGLSKEDLQIAASTNLDSAQADIKRRIMNGWQTRALTGLSHLKTNESVKLLETLAEDQSSPFNSLAKSLLSQN